MEEKVEEKTYKCRSCGSVMHKEDRTKQFERVKAGIKEIFPSESSDKLEEYTKNYIGYGPNYMYACDSCNIVRKIIPDGRDRE